MRLSRSRRWALIVALILVAAGLRFYRLGVSPLRGDEAFTIRYWAAPPAEVLRDLAGHEPHPLGALFGFGAWKALVGASETAMRLLPALLNVLGVPILYNLGRRLFRDEHVGYTAALLWAVNPYQIWHAQDVRNYAIWSTLSACSMWLLVRASDRRRRVDWTLYVMGQTAALYVFFLEPFFLIVGGLYVLLWRRAAWRGWLRSLALIGLLLIPWWAQAWALVHSGYQGTAQTMHIADLLTRFLPALLVGEANPAFWELWSMLLFVLWISALLLARRGRQSTAQYLALYLIVPTLLLTLAATRMSVFLPRYLIAATPALLLLLAYGLVSVHRWIGFYRSQIAWGGVILFALICVALPLFSLWHSSYRKATDWFGLRDYLQAVVRPDDLVLLTALDPKTGNGDPAFDYYFGGLSDVYSLPRTVIDNTAYIRQAAAHYRAIWFVPSAAEAGPIDQALRTNTQLISDQGAGVGLLVREYRAPERKPIEIEHTRPIHVGELALQGYSLEQTAHHLTVLLFWQPGTQSGDTLFVHLIDTINPASGSPLWAQDDHPPLMAARDVYQLDLANIPPGSYRLEIGLYDPVNPAQRRQWLDAEQHAIGDSILLTIINLTSP